MRKMREPDSEVMRGSDAQRFLVEKRIDELKRFRLLVGVENNFVARANTSEAGATFFFGLPVSLDEPAKLEVIREKKIRKMLEVAPELFAFFDLRQIDVDILRF